MKSTDDYSFIIHCCGDYVTQWLTHCIVVYYSVNYCWPDTGIYVAITMTDLQWMMIDRCIVMMILWLRWWYALVMMIPVVILVVIVEDYLWPCCWFGIVIDTLWSLLLTHDGSVDAGDTILWWYCDVVMLWWRCWRLCCYYCDAIDVIVSIAIISLWRCCWYCLVMTVLEDVISWRLDLLFWYSGILMMTFIVDMTWLIYCTVLWRLMMTCVAYRWHSLIPVMTDIMEWSWYWYCIMMWLTMMLVQLLWWWYMMMICDWCYWWPDVPCYCVIIVVMMLCYEAIMRDDWPCDIFIGMRWWYCWLWYCWWWCDDWPVLVVNILYYWPMLNSTDVVCCVIMVMLVLVLFYSEWMLVLPMTGDTIPYYWPMMLLILWPLTDILDCCMTGIDGKLLTDVVMILLWYYWWAVIVVVIWCWSSIVDIDITSRWPSVLLMVQCYCWRWCWRPVLFWCDTSVVLLVLCIDVRPLLMLCDGWWRYSYVDDVVTILIWYYLWWPVCYWLLMVSCYYDMTLLLMIGDIFVMMWPVLLCIEPDMMDVTDDIDDCCYYVIDYYCGGVLPFRDWWCWLTLIVMTVLCYDTIDTIDVVYRYWWYWADYWWPTIDDDRLLTCCGSDDCCVVELHCWRYRWYCDWYRKVCITVQAHCWWKLLIWWGQYYLCELLILWLIGI